MTSSEKRAFRRVPVKLTAHCRIGARYIRDAIGDLSESGMYLTTREPAREGTLVRVAVALPAEDGPKFCSLPGTVARVDRDARGLLRGLGISFFRDQIERIETKWLKLFIAQST